MDIQEILRSREIIHSDPEIMSGMPVFVGSHVPLQTYFDYLEGEEGLAEFINDFPYPQTQAIAVLETIANDRGSQTFSGINYQLSTPVQPSVLSLERLES